jgi:hypothetical protein
MIAIDLFLRILTFKKTKRDKNCNGCYHITIKNHQSYL